MIETCQEEESLESLDSFFAKKDKSKKPKKKKKTKSDETTSSSSSVETKKGQEKDDWNDFEEEKEKDYSSLKIQDLQVMEESKEELAEETEENEEDDEGVKKKNESGKWNIPTSAQAQKAAADAPELPGTQNVVGGKYVPPSVKRSMMMGMGQVSRGKPVAAPDIKSKAAFPTLSAANQDLSTPNRSQDFEVVRRGIKTNEARVDDHKPRLDLGNRYDGLRH